jgi:hypothetical protein
VIDALYHGRADYIPCHLMVCSVLRYKKQLVEGSQCCLSTVATEQSIATISEKRKKFQDKVYTETFLYVYVRRRFFLKIAASFMAQTLLM